MTIAHYTPEQDDIIRRMAAEGKSYTDTAKALGRTTSGISKRARKLGVRFHGKPGVKKGTNIVQFPKRPRPAPRPAAAEAPKLRVVSNNVPMMIADWVAKNGVRRFERGFSTDYSYLKDYLVKHDIVLKMVRNDCFISKGPGRPRKVGWTKVWQMVDDFRTADGLEPILREGRRA
jgi:hypothetical protein